MALHYFAQQKVQVAVIETGLGGRWDSTNIVHPILSLVTNISLDHVELLGGTLREIAAEKAGIAKSGVPLLLGAIDEELVDVFEREAALRSSPLLHSHHYRVSTRTTSWSERIVEIYRGDELKYEHLRLAMVADYYVDNLPLILMATDELRARGFSCPEASFRSVMGRFSMKGRFERLSDRPLTIYDIAHNVAALRRLFTQLRRMHTANWHIVFGLSREKLSDELLDELPSAATYYLSQSNVPRACPVEELSYALSSKNLRTFSYHRPVDALEVARRAALDDDLVLVCGSAYLIGAIDEVNPLRDGSSW